MVAREQCVNKCFEQRIYCVSNIIFCISYVIYFILFLLSCILFTLFHILFLVFYMLFFVFLSYFLYLVCYLLYFVCYFLYLSVLIHIFFIDSSLCLTPQLPPSFSFIFFLHQIVSGNQGFFLHLLILNPC